MAFLSLDHQKRVLYACSCSLLSPLGELYFCRHCKLQRCQDCVSSVVDSFSCPHCFENVPVTEARKRENRCGHCFQCPQCASTLSTRSVIVPSEVLGDQSPVKQEQPSQPGAGPPSTPRSSSTLRSPGGTKLYYLSCTHCKWSTREVDIRDKRSPMDFKDRPSPYQKRIDELVAFYREFAIRDRTERERIKKPGRRIRSYGNLLDPSKFTAAKTQKGSESPSPPRRGSSQIVWHPSLPEKMAAQTTENPDPLPDEFYTTPLNLEDATTLEQRFLDPVHQPTARCDMWPRPLHLIGKRLHRCKGCDHILLKAEINPASIRFKIQQIALHVFPQVRLLEFPKLQSSSSCEVLLLVTNPVNYSMTISFSECSIEFLKRIKQQLSPVQFPTETLSLTPNDDVGDILEGDQEEEIEVDPGFIHSRSPGKVIVKFYVTPEGAHENVYFAFVMKFTHKSTVDTEKQNEFTNVHVPIVVHAGQVA